MKIDGNSVRINCTIEGEAARALLELKKSGIFKSNREIVAHALVTLYEQELERQLKWTRAKMLEEDNLSGQL
ncbi:MAG: hypothetical protein QXJ62_01320 [Nitrososphaeria archaeon]